VRRHISRAMTGAAVLAGFSGCSTFWDDVTSRDFQVKAMFTRQDPMLVLRESTDGDARAKAILALKEPKAGGGGDTAQDAMIEVLTRAAISDPQPLCRLAAAQALGDFKDPRAVQVLIGCYEAAGQLQGDAATAVQTTALVSLGKTGQPSAVALLVNVASKPTPPDAPDKDVQQQRDIRLAAVRALNGFQGSAEVATAMARIAQQERDVALRDRARETYVKVTGKEPEAAPPPLPDAKPKAGDDIRLAGGRP
jgi:HEAT repeat protein